METRSGRIRGTLIEIEIRFSIRYIRVRHSTSHSMYENRKRNLNWNFLVNIVIKVRQLSLTCSRMHQTGCGEYFQLTGKVDSN